MSWRLAAGSPAVVEAAVRVGRSMALAVAGLVASAMDVAGSAFVGNPVAGKVINAVNGRVSSIIALGEGVAKSAESGRFSVIFVGQLA